MSDNIEVLQPRPVAVAQSRAVGAGAFMSAEAQRQLASMQSAVVMAKQFPRERVRCMDTMKNECALESFAARAQFSYPRGNEEVSGPSIRVAEMIARHWGNFDAGWTELSRTLTRDGIVGVSEVEAFAWDMETNTRTSLKFSVRHWRDTRKGGYAVTEERDIYEMCANAASRRKRACILSLLPGDVVESVMQECEATLTKKGTLSPEKITSMVKMFNDIGVTREMIEKRIQRRVEQILPMQAITLGKIYTALEEGVAVKSDYFDVPEGAANTGSSAAAAVDALKTEPKTVEPESAAKAEPEKVKDAAGPATTPKVVILDWIDAEGVVTNVDVPNFKKRFLGAIKMGKWPHAEKMWDQNSGQITKIPDIKEQDEIRDAMNVRMKTEEKANNHHQPDPEAVTQASPSGGGGAAEVKDPLDLPASMKIDPALRGTASSQGDLGGMPATTKKTNPFKK